MTERLQDTLTQRVWCLDSKGLLYQMDAAHPRAFVSSNALRAEKWVTKWLRGEPRPSEGPKGRHIPHVDLGVYRTPRPAVGGFDYAYDALLTYAFWLFVTGVDMDEVEAALFKEWQWNPTLHTLSPESTASVDTPTPRQPPEYMPGPEWVPQARGTSGFEFL